MVKKINDILNINIKPYDIFVDENESNSFMKSAKQVVYDFIPNDEKFNLIHQIKKCAVSIPSNIAEGCGRQTAKETINFLHISRGSLYELETQCYVALDQKYIDENNFNIVFNQMQSCKKLLNGFINYYKKLL